MLLLSISPREASPRATFRKSAHPELPVPFMMITCPRTGKPVSTGHSNDSKSFAAIKPEGNKSRCSSCGGTHMWDKKDTWVAEEAPDLSLLRIARKKVV